MICLGKLERILTGFPSSFLFLLLSTAALSGSCVYANQTESSAEQNTIYYNLTLCSLNATMFGSAFPWILEAYAVFPLITLAVSFGFVTTAHFLDAAYLTSLVIIGFSSGKFVFSGVFLVFAVSAFILFIYRFILNCCALRFGCTRHTNFLVTPKGPIPHYGPLLVVEGGKALTSSGPVDYTDKILDGRQAVCLSKTTAEKWLA